MRFEFGKNWKTYIDKYLEDKSIEEAEKSLTDFLQVPNLQGKVFLDIGCGSGLFSYAAHKLGASKVVSFDVDGKSVECCEYLRTLAGKPDAWEVCHGSILDDQFTDKLKKADIVYAWGVLHHTGNMWTAIRNAANLTKPGGLLFISVYNKVEYAWFKHYRGSYLWLKIKKIYNYPSKFIKKLLELGYMVLVVAKMLGRGRNPVNEIQAYNKRYRGMSWRVDVVDWLGGYPYEFATAEEITNFCKKELNLEPVKLKLGKYLGCNQYLFRKPELQAIFRG